MASQEEPLKLCDKTWSLGLVAVVDWLGAPAGLYNWWWAIDRLATPAALVLLITQAWRDVRLCLCLSWYHGALFPAPVIQTSPTSYLSLSPSFILFLFYMYCQTFYFLSQMQELQRGITPLPTSGAHSYGQGTLWTDPFTCIVCINVALASVKLTTVLTFCCSGFRVH